jgi:hypothetical protein
MIQWKVPNTEIEPIIGFKARMTDQVTNVTSIVYD